MESTVIRTAMPEDLPVIRRLFEESVYEGQTRINDTGADIDNFAEASATPAFAALSTEAPTLLGELTVAFAAELAERPAKRQRTAA